MSSGPFIERQKSESLDIPSRRVEITDPSQLPSNFSTTPGGTIFSTTPGGMNLYAIFSLPYVNVVEDIFVSTLCSLGKSPKRLQFLDMMSRVFNARAELVNT